MLEAARNLVGPTGGLRYHTRALRYAHTLWAPFRQALATWLKNCPLTPQRHLMIIGPSGGYCLTGEFLSRFDQITGVDIDPLASTIFRRRFSNHPNIQWIREDVFRMKNQDTDLSRFRDLIHSDPNAVILFSNVLGQLPFLISEEDARMSIMRRLGVSLRQHLEGRTWISFHDRTSGPLPLTFSQPKAFPHAAIDGEIVRDLYRRKPPIELIDHETFELFPKSHPRAYFHWELVPRWYHLIEGIYSSSTPPASPQNH